MTEQASFGRELFGFLAELKDHNDRDWFAANKGRYEADLLEPALAFIEDFEPHLQAISPHLRADARRVGGSMFRIYRDTRFSKDKSPYKTMAGIYFRHERSKEVRAPGFYLHLAPREVFAGGGIWHPDTKTARSARRSRPTRRAGGPPHPASSSGRATRSSACRRASTRSIRSPTTSSAGTSPRSSG